MLVPEHGSPPSALHFHLSTIPFSPLLYLSNRLNCTSYLNTHEELACGVGKQCSRHRRTGARRRRGRTAQRPHHGQHGSGYACQNKSSSSAGTKPGKTNAPSDMIVGYIETRQPRSARFCLAENQDGFSIITVGNDRVEIDLANPAYIYKLLISPYPLPAGARESLRGL